jgi:uncharacterized protein
LNPDDKRLEPRLSAVLALLRGQSTMTLSTCDDAGWPQATPLFYYVDDDLGLHWYSAAHSAHSKHILRERRVSVAVSVPTEQWREIRGVQMRGEVSMITGQARNTINGLFCARFDLGATFRLVMMQSRLFRFQPSWIRYLDNTKGLGYKFEINPPGRTNVHTPEETDVREGAPDVDEPGRAEPE